MTLRTARWTTLAAGSAATLLIAGCGGGGGSPENAATSGEGLTVLAGFYPLEWAASRVGGDLASVSSLTPAGAEAHDLELTPQDVAAVSEADLLVYIEGFQPALDEAAESEAREAAWDAGQAASLTLTAEEDEDGHGAEDQHADEEEEHADEGEIVDPHFWLDPTRLADVGDALAERMGELDPDNAAAYAENAVALRADLEELDGEMQEALSGCAINTLVTSHDAFGYLADRYGFEVVGISGLDPSEEPSPAQMAEIAELVQERGATTVYTETLVDPAVAETVAAEAGVGTAVLDPLEGLTDESAGDDYLEVMRANLETLREGQSCA
ncbi:zinc transport system substrate-binding protein [Blastococcus colisei]|uniref:Zinc transport system substrate-binding protein n=1 Tax=Blastococcus colisei TaxID=1564162 RepID=A0A543PI06_9ACTN|nr:metal ABC transporter substrate-binding protein [Blastococcus colisei]TQN43689.1 zinc transport system substrate-binding protein [Blastococcus colisei]